MSIFEVALESFIDMNHELVLLSKQIDWAEMESESEFAEYYARTMVVRAFLSVRW